MATSGTGTSQQKIKSGEIGVRGGRNIENGKAFGGGLEISPKDRVGSSAYRIRSNERLLSAKHKRHENKLSPGKCKTRAIGGGDESPSNGRANGKMGKKNSFSRRTYPKVSTYWRVQKPLCYEGHKIHEGERNRAHVTRGVSEFENGRKWKGEEPGSWPV